MAEHISLLDDNFDNVKECLLHKRSHTFCVDCLETKNFHEDSCQLCRPFYAIPDNGCGGYSRDDLMEKLVDLHESFVEINLNVAEKTIDIPLVEEFNALLFCDKGAKRKGTSLVGQFIGGGQEDLLDAHIAWLDNKIYVAHYGMKGVRVFTDHTPFTELPERINIEKLDHPCGMVASTISNSIFISDMYSNIWKIQLPDYKLCRKKFCSDYPEHLSITPDNELLAVMGLGENSLDFFSLGDLSRTKSISVPFHCKKISCAAQLPNKNIVISYAEDYIGETVGICILTADGDVIRKFDPNMFELFQLNPWCPANFAVADDGQLFIVDQKNYRLFLFNSQMTDFYSLNVPFGSIDIDIPRIVYIKGRQQLLVVCEEIDKWNEVCLSMVHLSPCNLIRGGSTESLPAESLPVLPAVDKSRILRKRKANKFSTWNFQKLGMKRRR